jgi:probable phosphoglycerate mutase
MELLLIRHALPVRREDVEGPADPELSVAGRAQAQHLADYLVAEGLGRLYSSPMKRALQTADPVGVALGLPIVTHDGVAEYDRHSTWYVPVEELKAAGDPRWKEMLDKKGHEAQDIDPYEFRAMVVAAIEEIIGANSGRKVAVVCHGGVINAYLTHMLGIDDPTGFFYPNYTSIHRIAAARSGERSVLTVNETAHLRGTGLPVGIFAG